MSERWKIRELSGNTPPDLIFDGVPTTFTISGYGLGEVEIQNAEYEWTRMSTMAAISAAVARGYPRPPLALVQEFLRLNERDWDAIPDPAPGDEP